MLLPPSTPRNSTQAKTLWHVPPVLTEEKTILPPLTTLLQKCNAIKLIIEFLHANPKAFTFKCLIILEDEDQGVTSSQPTSPPTT
ncbi:hypothetical protein AMATHDRAFT_8648 [Amanita thiersii Skay4041]|uniref:Uncharacterized protein n=1 Tax=Amanita thiersii Skay4041 TaxID=703135 RepID=A0A2A9NDT1_9AGAR|nr:hypothetical protein AMATHDRAFT_8648 [Amanita thiersii Skay4041]